MQSNESLGLAEVELLRRLNCTLSPTVPGWFYMAEVKEPLAHGVLARRPGRGRLELPADRLPWAQEYARHLTDHLGGAGYDIVGDLSDLVPAPAGGGGLHPADVTDEDLLDAAVAASAGLLQRRYRRDCGRGPDALGTAPALRRRLRRLSERNRLVGAAQSTIRTGIERSRAR